MYIPTLAHNLKIYINFSVAILHYSHIDINDGLFFYKPHAVLSVCIFHIYYVT